MALADRVKQLRGMTGLTQKEFGRLVGLSDGFISLLESGRRAGMSYAAARQMASAYGTKPEWLMFGEGDEPKQRTVTRALNATVKANGPDDEPQEATGS